MHANDLTQLHGLFVQLSTATGLIMLCVVIHGLGLALLTRMINLSDSSQRTTQLPPISMRGIFLMLWIVLFLFVIHGIEIWLFAFFYEYMDALPDLESSVYFSIISYGTVGYNDADVLQDWRLVGALEGVTGIILLGWSTAFFVSILGRLDLR